MSAPLLTVNINLYAPLTEQEAMAIRKKTGLDVWYPDDEICEETYGYPGDLVEDLEEVLPKNKIESGIIKNLDTDEGERYTYEDGEWEYETAEYISELSDETLIQILEERGYVIEKKQNM